MFQTDLSNTVFKLASDLVNHTSQHIFLTGKAGTGKTTFLRHIQATTSKNTVVVAPTGVAAINAGGVTMHSFFQLPFGPFIPGTANREGVIGFAEATDKHSLFKNIHFTSNKRELLQEMELLIIDEVSMMRADMLDAIDTILRHFRKAYNVPFGGVQVVYIGDMFQLPPVTGNDEWNLLQHYYASPFFFSAKVIAEAPPLYIELKKIYRQNEQQFIDILNRIRNNIPQRSDFDFLNSKYDPSFVSPHEDHFITITTHNKKADTINSAHLDSLPGKLYLFKATIKDDFSEKALPTELELRIKEGAQVMFVKNDSGGERRYYNGKIATVKEIEDEEITVTFEDGEDLVLEKETWKNIRYIYNKEDDDIDEEVLGSFTQYPIRLAWAITVHKSQGLTFEKAIIDAGSSFAAGQVYVALSRCTSMERLVLKSKITPSSISTDQRIIEFAQREANDDQLIEILEREKYRHWSAALIKLFDWSKITGGLFHWKELIPDKKLPDVPATLDLARDLLDKAKAQAVIAEKFQKQLNQLLNSAPTGETAQLEERMKKAISFFAKALASEILEPLQKHIGAIRHASKITKYKEEIVQLEGLIWQHLQKLLTASYGELKFPVAESYDALDPAVKGKVAAKSKKPAKGDSKLASLELFRKGEPIDTIAKMRNMAYSTIFSHLSHYVSTGDVEISQLVEEDKVQAILKIIENTGTESMGAIKSKLGDEISFSDIRAVISHHQFLQKQAV